ncbi:malto-oligosyltrehalose synthase [Novosphingobium sp. 9]|uniref:malto-oligosyltrehalose synthase n=1 Tax=Novosphingobium sp. 9 TaxID=2025349 RepID=UPI0028CB47ED|nr:malto-oligosyltrehalose synthase [Novosphingobium sp. 9]
MPEMISAPVATYRLQLRDGVDLLAAQKLLPWLNALGVSHLYLSPLMAAVRGSSHGYDVTDPTRVDPELGGETAFAALAVAARQAGVGLILDIVPNHQAFSPQNPFVADILRYGPDSEHAKMFDIDWDRGRLHFPVLDRPTVDLLEGEALAISGTGELPALKIYDEIYPLNPTSLAAALASGERALDADGLEKLLAQQHWSVGHWRDSAGQIIHRRFFNISGLIGVRQEDPVVFDLTHRWLFEQVAAGHVQGVRVDHVDGLARPGNYLNRLRAALDAISSTPMPIWIEKIVKADEALPRWPVAGMSGYEFLAPLTRLLMPATGLAALHEAANGAVPADVSDEVRNVRGRLLQDTFAPERARVLQAARTALASDAADSAGQAARHDDAVLADALDSLACDWPVYRSYAADGCPLEPGPQAALAKAQGHGATLLADLLHAPDDTLSRAFATRFEQLTGALTAKSEEDTVFFRAVACLAFCEVGLEPDLGVLEPIAFERAMQKRADQTPLGLSTLSTHDTKRSADARAALIALAWRPTLAQELYRAARSEAEAMNLPSHVGLYAMQTALVMRGADNAGARIDGHLAKALREGKVLSSHEVPQEKLEKIAGQLSRGFLRDLDDHVLWSREQELDFDTVREAIILAQVAFQMTAPGVPDIYRGSEVLHVALTDPDNRRSVDFHAIEAFCQDETSICGRKLALTRHLLARRGRDPELFVRGDYRLEETTQHWIVTRRLDGRQETIFIPRPAMCTNEGRSTDQAMPAPPVTPNTSPVM